MWEGLGGLEEGQEGQGGREHRSGGMGRRHGVGLEGHHLKGVHELKKGEVVRRWTRRGRARQVQG